MFNNVIDSNLCTGCGVCRYACPLSCITMKKNEDGFIYPYKNDNCINCGICENACPRINPIDIKGISQKSYAACAKDKKAWRKGSSGGAFSEICKLWDNGDTMFVGVAWEGLTVSHKYVTNIDNVGIFNKSKYIESDLSNSYEIIKKHLEHGGNTVFSGTPCQVAGLRRYLKRDYDKLLLIDLICHGVGSPYVFNECIRVIGSELKRKIISYQFRYKGRVYSQDHIEKVLTSKGESIYLEKDRYIQLFTNQLCLRKSCGKNCIYRNSQRMGDITIGDFKGLSSVFPNLIGTKKNYSTIVFNTKKGTELLERLHKSMYLYECSIDDIKKYNPIFCKHTWFAENRENFFDDFKRDANNAIISWTEPSMIYKRSFYKAIYDILPVFARRFLIQLRRRTYGH